MSVSTLKRCIEKLADAGYLIIEHRGQEGVSLPNQYHLNIGFTPEVSQESVDSDVNERDQSEPNPVHSELPPVHSEPTHPVHSELGVGSHRATKQEFKQEYIKQEDNLSDADKSASGGQEIVVSDVLPKQQQQESEETLFQNKCRLAWTMYSAAFAQRYSVKPVRNAKVNAQVKQLVQRLGEEAGMVAEFFVFNVNERFVVQKTHDLGLLLSSAESYRTQWATGRAMTQTRAGQIDSTQANASALDEALNIARSRRNQGEVHEQC